MAERAPTTDDQRRPDAPTPLELFTADLASVDAEIHAAIGAEQRRQREQIELNRVREHRFQSGSASTGLGTH